MVALRGSLDGRDDDGARLGVATATGEVGSAFGSTKKNGDADAWLLNMGFAISGMTRKLNFRKLGPRVGAVSPSVRKQDRFSAPADQVAEQGEQRVPEQSSQRNLQGGEAPYLVNLDG